ncbi:MAG: hypothetical protein NZM11_13390 [Anaerolineales bacterium]|nr:hypothetical protein [Anaerolineales bacterium]
MGDSIAVASNRKNLFAKETIECEPITLNQKSAIQNLLMFEKLISAQKGVFAGENWVFGRKLFHQNSVT